MIFFHKCETGSLKCADSDPDVLFTLEPDNMNMNTSTVEPKLGLSTDLTVNSVVEVTLASGNAYGIIRWIGNLSGRQEAMAGLELVM